MNTLATSNSSSADAATPTSPPSVGRRSGYSQETAGRLCEMIRRRGLSDAAAALSLGIPRQTLSRWKQEQPELEDWLAMAREQYREAKLALVDEAKTADGRPDWKAAVWALAKAFPEDYGRSAGTARQASAAAFFPNPEQSRTMCGPTPAEFGALIEENEALRAELRALRP